MGVKSKKKAKTRLDAYYRLAKDQGYRARSAFKLIQLNRKYDFLSKCKSLVDLCAAPGGWCQVAAKYMPVGSKIVGVDLVPIAPIRGVKTFVGDITDDKTRKMILTFLKKELVDIVIHDGAPNVGGVWARDLFDQNSLVLSSLKLATGVLKPGGWFVTKVFRSGDFQKLMWVIGQFFDKCEATKPLASRMESAECFVVCAGYKAPKTIDPKLFNAQSVFEDVGQERILSASGTLYTPKTNVPQGYDEMGITSRTASLTEFLESHDAKGFLGHFHVISFSDEERKTFLRLKCSKKELVFLCQDLQQVGPADVKRLLRWREQLLKERDALALLNARTAAAAAAGAGKKTGVVFRDDVDIEEGEDEEGDADDDDDEDDVAEEAEPEDIEATENDILARELLSIRKKQAKQLKKKQKKIVDRKLKQVRGLINHDPIEASRHPTEMGAGAQVAEEEDVDGSDDDDDDDVTTSSSENEDEARFDPNADWTIADVKRLADADVNDMFDRHHEVAESKLNTALNAVTDVHLRDEDEIDMGKGRENDDAERPLQVVEGQEENYDVDNYGNYIHATKADRVEAFRVPGVDGDEDQGEGDEEALDPVERKRKQNDEQLEQAGKQAKWLRRHTLIDQVLNKTFPKPRDPKRSRSYVTEEERITLGEKAASSSADPETAERAAKKARKEALEKGRLRDESASDDDVEDDDDDEFDDAFDEEDRDDDDDADSNKGIMKKAFAGKKLVVPSVGNLTATAIAREQRKQVEKTNADLKKKQARKQAANGGKGKLDNNNLKKKKQGDKEDTSFEEIPLAMTDPDVRARTLAMATKMLDKRTRNDMYENSINRFMAHDDEDLPDWFIMDEQRNCKVQTPVTAAEMEAQRRRFIEINARPSKKVMEAMGRKRRRAQRMLRGLLDKGRTDPRVRDKVKGLSVRKLMRSKTVKFGPGGSDTKKRTVNKRDSRSRGEMTRNKQRQAKMKKGGRR